MASGHGAAAEPKNHRNLNDMDAVSRTTLLSPLHHHQNYLRQDCLFPLDNAMPLFKDRFNYRGSNSN